MQWSSDDLRFMSRALTLAERGRGRVSPNPMVGCVVVRKSRVVSEGWHRRFGGQHAEPNALRGLRSAKGATIYLTLEPCSYTRKKTPPCAPLVVSKRPRRVVIAMKDPNPMVVGGGVAALRSAGIRVDVGCRKKEAAELIRAYALWKKTGRPYVTVKVASSIDGKIASRAGVSKWITSQRARKFARRMRDEYDAILVGKNTVLLDNPMLAGVRREPRRIILDSTLSVPLRSRVFRDHNVLVATTSRAPASRRRVYEKSGIPFLVLGRRITIPALLRALAKEQISSVWVEGGAEVFGSFFDARRVDEVQWFFAPKILGGTAARGAIGGLGAASPDRAPQLRNIRIIKIGSDFLIRGFPQWPV